MKNHSVIILVHKCAGFFHAGGVLRRYFVSQCFLQAYLDEVKICSVVFNDQYSKRQKSGLSSEDTRWLAGSSPLSPM